MNEMLIEVKKRLQITHDYQDDMLSGWINDAKMYLKNAGADETAIDTAYGVITKAVFDMWTAKEFSALFYDMASQFVLANPKISDDEDDGE